MEQNQARTRLRLAGADDQASLDQWRGDQNARQNIATENRAAAANPNLNPADPRWRVAVRAYGEMQGTLLTPERRASVVRAAKALGVPAFQTNVIIAVVQDNARRGLPLQDVAVPLTLIPDAQPKSASRLGLRGVLIAVLALVWALVLVRWIVGG